MKQLWSHLRPQNWDFFQDMTVGLSNMQLGQVWLMGHEETHSMRQWHIPNLKNNGSNIFLRTTYDQMKRNSRLLHLNRIKINTSFSTVPNAVTFPGNEQLQEMQTHKNIFQMQQGKYQRWLFFQSSPAVTYSHSLPSTKQQCIGLT